MSRAVIILNTAEDRQRAALWAAKLPWGTRIEFKETKRSVPQNSRLWAMLTDVARQATWAGKRRTTEQWKDLFTGAVKAAANGLEAVPGLEGGFMILGLHTSDMSVAEMTELQDYIEAWGAQNGVTFSDQMEKAA